ncbi:MAG: hypothetical protein Q4A88_09640, partial [Clostridia bacterium]|nr:hypothetical protein [Clostridia bacterium]
PEERSDEGSQNEKVLSTGTFSNNDSEILHLSLRVGFRMTDFFNSPSACQKLLTRCRRLPRRCSEAVFSAEGCTDATPRLKKRLIFGESIKETVVWAVSSYRFALFLFAENVLDTLLTI